MGTMGRDLITQGTPAIVYDQRFHSCRVERFLGAADEEDVEQVFDLDPEAQIQRSNWQVVNCSTPANYFHVLRRQVRMKRMPKFYLCLGQASISQASDCRVPQAAFEAQGVPVRPGIFPVTKG